MISNETINVARLGLRAALQAVQDFDSELTPEDARRLLATVALVEEVPDTRDALLDYDDNLYAEVRRRIHPAALLATARGARQSVLVAWAEQAFGREEASSVPQRGLRLLEEAVEAYQACGGDEATACKLVTFVFAHAPGEVGQELGGVAVTSLLLAAAVGVSADEVELREIRRVLSKPVQEFTERNARKNAAGFKAAPTLRNPCCGNIGTHGEGRGEHCSTCGAALGRCE